MPGFFAMDNLLMSGLDLSTLSTGRRGGFGFFGFCSHFIYMGNSQAVENFLRYFFFFFGALLCSPRAKGSALGTRKGHAP